MAKGNVSKNKVLELTKEIRDLIDLGASDRQIIDHYKGKIDRATFYRYKKRIRNEIIKKYEKESEDSRRTRNVPRTIRH